jgi:hypothetical protein
MFTPAPAGPALEPGRAPAPGTARYGSATPPRWSARGASDGDLHRIPGTQTLWLELAIATRCEVVQHLDDLLLRRTRLGILLPRGGLDHLPRIRELCAPHLLWDEVRWEHEVDRYRALIAAHYSQPPGAAQALGSDHAFSAAKLVLRPQSRNEWHSMRNANWSRIFFFGSMSLRTAGAGMCARRRSHFRSLRRKKVTKERATPLSRVPFAALRGNLRCAAQSGVRANSPAAQTARGPDSALRLCSSARAEGIGIAEQPCGPSLRSALASASARAWPKLHASGAGIGVGSRFQRSETRAQTPIPEWWARSPLAQATAFKTIQKV